MKKVDVKTFRSSTVDPDQLWLAQTRYRILNGDISNKRFAMKRRVMRFATGAIAVGAVTAVAVGLLPTSNDDMTFRPGPVNAAEVLNLAAANADSVVQADFGAAQYVYIRSHEKTVTTVYVDQSGMPIDEPPAGRNDIKELRYYDETVKESWRLVDSALSAKFRGTSLGYEPISPRAELENAFEKMGRDFNEPAPVIAYEAPNPTEPIKITKLNGDIDPHNDDPTLNPTPATLAVLPTDPKKLHTALSDFAKLNSEGNGSAVSVLIAITNLLRQGDALVNNELRQALFLVAADLPGLKRYKQTDLDGRAGETLGIDHESGRTEMIIDPEKSQVLGYRTIVTSDKNGKGGSKEMVVNRTSTTSAIVDNIGQTK